MPRKNFSRIRSKIWTYEQNISILTCHVRMVGFGGFYLCLLLFKTLQWCSLFLGWSFPVLTGPAHRALCCLTASWAVSPFRQRALSLPVSGPLHRLFALRESSFLVVHPTHLLPLLPLPAYLHFLRDPALHWRPPARLPPSLLPPSEAPFILCSCQDINSRRAGEFSVSVLSAVCPSQQLLRALLNERHKNPSACVNTFL